MELIMAQPRGFCAGVERAIDAVHAALRAWGAPVYVRHEIVHNHSVVRELENLGVRFVESLDEVPPDVPLIFSAHGVAPAVMAQAKSARLQVIDATCPLVTKVHLEVAEHSRAGRAVVVIGHRQHVEVVGTVGHAQGAPVHVIESAEEVQGLALADDAALAYVTQTTLSVDDTAKTVAALRKRFVHIAGPHKDDICYATQNRQRAVADLAARCQLVLIVGSAHSSNTLRMLEVAQARGTRAHRIDVAAELSRDWFEGVQRIGLSSGASVPERLVDAVRQQLLQWWPDLVTHSLGEPEDLHFRLPRELDNHDGPARLMNREIKLDQHGNFAVAAQRP